MRKKRLVPLRSTKTVATSERPRDRAASLHWPALWQRPAQTRQVSTGLTTAELTVLPSESSAHVGEWTAADAGGRVSLQHRPGADRQAALPALTVRAPDRRTCPSALTLSALPGLSGWASKDVPFPDLFYQLNQMRNSPCPSIPRTLRKWLWKQLGSWAAREEWHGCCPNLKMHQLSKTRTKQETKTASSALSPQGTCHSSVGISCKQNQAMHGDCSISSS